MTNSYFRLSLMFMLTVAPVFSVFSGAGSAFAAQDRPKTTIMDYVPQNIGIYDTYYEFFSEDDCRACHPATPEPHHATQRAVDGQCMDCHCEDPYLVPPIRDCQVCHTDGAKFCGSGQPQGGDFGSPHHRTEMAESGLCTACHNPNLVSETYSQPVPAYNPTWITPTPYACENCHWPTNCNEVLPERLDPNHYTWDDGAVCEWSTGDNYVKFSMDWSTWPLNNPMKNGPTPGDGFPRPTTDETGDHPAPIMANGDTTLFLDTGAGGYFIQEASKAFMPQTGTHHEIGRGTVLSGNIWGDGSLGGSGRCYFCHADEPDSGSSVDPNDPAMPYYFRYCENCHDIFTLHDIDDHVLDRIAIYTVGGNLNQEVLAGGVEGKCGGCHGDAMGLLPISERRPNPEWYMGPAPSFGSPGTLVEIRGRKFAPRYAPGGVGAVEIDTTGNGTWVECTIDYWQDLVDPSDSDEVTRILFRIPEESTFNTTGLPLNSPIRVKKANPLYDPLYLVPPPNKDKTTQYYYSTNKGFTVRQHPIISATVEGIGAPIFKQTNEFGWGSKIEIHGEGFGNKQSKIYTATGSVYTDYGYASYVEIMGGNHRYRALKYVKPKGGQVTAALPGAYPKWTANDIACWLKIKASNGKTTLQDVLSGVNVPEQQLYQVSWSLTVVTDYFKDDGDNAYMDTSTGSLDLSTESLVEYGEIDDPENPYGPNPPDWNDLDGPNLLGGTGDTLLHRERSEPVTILVTDTPRVNQVKPKAQIKKKVVKLIGYNFGMLPGQVWVGNKKLADDTLFFDGSGAINTPAVLVANGVKYKLATLKTDPSTGNPIWTPNKVKFKAPKFGSNIPSYPKKKWVRVITSDFSYASPGARLQILWQ